MRPAGPFAAIVRSFRTPMFPSPIYLLDANIDALDFAFPLSGRRSGVGEELRVG
jgi:hypothetical protein